MDQSGGPPYPPYPKPTGRNQEEGLKPAAAAAAADVQRMTTADGYPGVPNPILGAGGAVNLAEPAATAPAAATDTAASSNNSANNNVQRTYMNDSIPGGAGVPAGQRQEASYATAALHHRKAIGFVLGNTSIAAASHSGTMLSGGSNINGEARVFGLSNSNNSAPTATSTLPGYAATGGAGTTSSTTMQGAGGTSSSTALAVGGVAPVAAVGADGTTNDDSTTTTTTTPPQQQQSSNATCSSAGNDDSTTILRKSPTGQDSSAVVSVAASTPVFAARDYAPVPLDEEMQETVRKERANSAAGSVSSVSGTAAALSPTGKQQQADAVGANTAGANTFGIGSSAPTATMAPDIGVVLGSCPRCYMSFTTTEGLDNHLKLCQQGKGRGGASSRSSSVSINPPVYNQIGTSAVGTMQPQQQVFGTSTLGTMQPQPQQQQQRELPDEERSELMCRLQLARARLETLRSVDQDQWGQLGLQQLQQQLQSMMNAGNDQQVDNSGMPGFGLRADNNVLAANVQQQAVQQHFPMVAQQHQPGGSLLGTPFGSVADSMPPPSQASTPQVIPGAAAPADTQLQVAATTINHPQPSDSTASQPMQTSSPPAAQSQVSDPTVAQPQPSVQYTDTYAQKVRNVVMNLCLMGAWDEVKRSLLRDDMMQYSFTTSDSPLHLALLATRSDPSVWAHAGEIVTARPDLAHIYNKDACSVLPIPDVEFSVQPRKREDQLPIFLALSPSLNRVELSPEHAHARINAINSIAAANLEALVLTDAEGRTPFHLSLLSPDLFFLVSQRLFSAYPEAARSPDYLGHYPLHTLCRSPKYIPPVLLSSLVDAYPGAASVRVIEDEQANRSLDSSNIHTPGTFLMKNVPMNGANLNLLMDKIHRYVASASAAYSHVVTAAQQKSDTARLVWKSFSGDKGAGSPGKESLGSSAQAVSTSDEMKQVANLGEKINRDAEDRVAALLAATEQQAAEDAAAQHMADEEAAQQEADEAAELARRRAAIYKKARRKQEMQAKLKEQQRKHSAKARAEKVRQKRQEKEAFRLEKLALQRKQRAEEKLRRKQSELEKKYAALKEEAKEQLNALQANGIPIDRAIKYAELDPNSAEGKAAKKRNAAIVREGQIQMEENIRLKSAILAAQARNQRRIEKIKLRNRAIVNAKWTELKEQLQAQKDKYERELREMHKKVEQTTIEARKRARRTVALGGDDWEAREMQLVNAEAEEHEAKKSLAKMQADRENAIRAVSEEHEAIMARDRAAYEKEMADLYSQIEEEKRRGLKAQQEGNQSRIASNKEDKSGTEATCDINSPTLLPPNNTELNDELPRKKEFDEEEIDNSAIELMFSLREDIAHLEGVVDRLLYRKRQRESSPNGASDEEEIIDVIGPDDDDDAKDANELFGIYERGP